MATFPCMHARPKIFCDSLHCFCSNEKRSSENPIFPDWLTGKMCHGWRLDHPVARAEETNPPRFWESPHRKLSTDHQSTSSSRQLNDCSYFLQRKAHQKSHLNLENTNKLVRCEKKPDTCQHKSHGRDEHHVIGTLRGAVLVVAGGPVLEGRCPPQWQRRRRWQQRHVHGSKRPSWLLQPRSRQTSMAARTCTKKLKR